MSRYPPIWRAAGQPERANVRHADQTPGEGPRARSARDAPMSMRGATSDLICAVKQRAHAANRLMCRTPGIESGGDQLLGRRCSRRITESRPARLDRHAIGMENYFCASGSGQFGAVDGFQQRFGRRKMRERVPLRHRAVATCPGDICAMRVNASAKLQRIRSRWRWASTRGRRSKAWLLACVIMASTQSEKLYALALPS